MGIRKAGVMLGLLAAAALPPLAVPSTANTTTAKTTASKTTASKTTASKTTANNPTANNSSANKPAAKKAAVAAKPSSDDPDAAAATIAPPSPAVLDEVGWRVIDDPATGAQLGLPSKLVPKAAPGRIGSRWTSGRGQIDIETFRLHEGALAALFDDEKKVRHRTVEHATLTPDSFVMSGMQGLKRFIVRVQAIGSELRGITIMYDQATEGLMAPIAAAMANTFQGFPDPGTAPPPGLRRSVEYGTAITVSNRGDFVTSAQIVNGCQTITVAGLGHAERVAVDTANDIALLRLYGAQGLVPAAIGGDGAADDDLILIGIADPLAQAGGDAVSRAAAHRSEQGLDPAPKLGFAGAAAVDAQGHFAGMADLKPAAVAGTAATVAVQATLVPAAALRGFLQAQSVAIATGNPTIEQSVVRVICVRK